MLIHLVPAASITSAVHPTAPVAAFTVTPEFGAASVHLQRLGLDVYPARTIVRYEWNWGDGESAIGHAPNEDHDYPLAGVYPVDPRWSPTTRVQRGSVTQVLPVN